MKATPFRSQAKAREMQQGISLAGHELGYSKHHILQYENINLLNPSHPKCE